MKTLEINIPEGLLDYLQELVDEGNFESVEVFISHASYWLAELYGFGEKTEGKSLSDLIAEQIISKTGTGFVVQPLFSGDFATRATPSRHHRRLQQRALLRGRSLQRGSRSQRPRLEPIQPH